jgi:Domain of unknown function (DUF4386)
MSVPAFRLGRLGAAAGLAFTAFTIAGNEMADSGNASGDSAATALANIQRAQGLTNHLGTAVEILGFIALMFFAGYMYRVLHSSEGEHGWLAATVLVTAAADLGVKLASGAPLAAAYYHRADLTPDLARTLVDLNNGSFIITGLTMAAFVLAVSFSAYGSRALPRTLTWIGVVLGALGLVTPIVGITDPASYNPLPYLISLVWVAAIGVARIVRETRQRRAADRRTEAR